MNPARARRKRARVFMINRNDRRHTRGRRRCEMVMKRKGREIGRQDLVFKLL